MKLSNLRNASVGKYEALPHCCGRARDFGRKSLFSPQSISALPARAPLLRGGGLYGARMRRLENTGLISSAGRQLGPNSTMVPETSGAMQARTIGHCELKATVPRLRLKSFQKVKMTAHIHVTQEPYLLARCCPCNGSQALGGLFRILAAA